MIDGHDDQCDWVRMSRAPRRALVSLSRGDLPASPGVYALFRDEERMYVGKAGNLRQRVWQNHCGRGRVLTGSAMRRNIAQHLKIALAADIKTRRYQPSDSELNQIRAWLDGCEIAWLETSTEPEAVALETALKRAFLPPLTRR